MKENRLKFLSSEKPLPTMVRALARRRYETPATVASGRARELLKPARRKAESEQLLRDIVGEHSTQKLVSMHAERETMMKDIERLKAEGSVKFVEGENGLP